jgi:hypothetical protein
MRYGIPRSSLDYSWGRKAFGWDRDEEVEIEHDVSRDYCPVCDKKSVIFQGQCVACSQIDEKNNH